MEFLLIGDSKIKIVLSREEAERYGLDKSSTDVADPAARRALWKILECAKERAGFDPAGDKVLIQLYPLKDGRCELFVTKLGILSESSARLVAKSDRVSMLSKKRLFYSFEDIDYLISAARVIKALSGDLIPKADVYTDGVRFYLAIDEYGKGGESLEFPSILEFGCCLTADFSAYICEHTERLTAGDGIAIFSSL